MTEIVTSGSMSGKVETELRRGLNGHQVGNDGHSQDQAYGPPRPFSTLHLPFPLKHTTRIDFCGIKLTIRHIFS